jgi:hypothetical protein
MNREEIKRAILNATGNPESGVIVDNLEAIADALIDEPQEIHYHKPVAETRVKSVKETR